MSWIRKKRAEPPEVHYEIEEPNYKERVFDSCQIINTLFNFIGKSVLSDDERDSWVDSGKWHFVPQDAERAFGVLSGIYNVLKEEGAFDFPTSTPTFIDAGCGIGNIVMIARCIGYRAYGIELNDKYVDMAEEILTSQIATYDHYNVKKGDILKEGDWGKYNVIYYFQPIKDQQLEIEFEKKVEEMAKPGAFIVAGMKRDHSFRKSDKFSKVKITVKESPLNYPRNFCDTFTVLRKNEQ